LELQHPAKGSAAIRSKQQIRDKFSQFHISTSPHLALFCAPLSDELSGIDRIKKFS